MEIAKYTISVGFRFEQREFRKLESQLKKLEKRLAKFANFTDKFVTFRIGKFSVDQKKLQFTLGNALDHASDKVVFEISRFAVHDRNLRAAMLRAGRRLGQGQVATQAQQMSGGAGSPRATRTDYSRSNYLHAGGAAGAFMRYGAGSLPFIGGAYGFSTLNRANQELVSANISAESVLGADAKKMLDRLAERSDYLGVSYRDVLPQFTKFMASSVPLMGAEASQQAFESFMQFGRTRGADKVSMNRALTAVGQMSAKGQVMAEELKNQLGDAAGFGELPQLFAEAYQVSTGGNLSGAEARAALMKAMEQGNVKTTDLLPIVTRLMDELSKGGIEKARNSSVAQQMRAENALLGRGGLLQQFSEGGGEQGFARFWKEITNLFKGAQPVVKALAGTFEDLSRVLQAPVFLFGRMNDVLTQLSESTGIAEKNFTNLALVGGLMATKWGRVGLIFTSLLVVLEDIAMGVSGEGDSLTGRFLEWLEQSGVVMGPLEKGLFGVSAALLAIATALKAVDAASSLGGVKDVLGGGKGGKGGGGLLKRLLPFAGAAAVGGGVVLGADWLAGGGESFTGNLISTRDEIQRRAQNPNSPFYNSTLQRDALAEIMRPNSPYFEGKDVAGYEQMERDRAMAAAEDRAMAASSSNIKVEVKADFQIQAGTAEEAASVLDTKLQDLFREAASNFSYGTQ